MLLILFSARAARTSPAAPVEDRDENSGGPSNAYLTISRNEDQDIEDFIMIFQTFRSVRNG